MLEPFTSQKTHGLELLSYRTKTRHLLKSDIEDKDTRIEFEETVVEMMKSILYYSMKRGLSSSRSEQQKLNITNKIFKNLKAKLRIEEHIQHSISLSSFECFVNRI